MAARLTRRLKSPWFWVTIVLLISFGQNLHTSTFITNEESVLRLSVLSWWRDIPIIFSRHFLIFTDGQFRPLSYALLAGLRTFIAPENLIFWHLWLLFFQLLNAVLVFLIARQFSQRLASAVIASLVFALHPLATVVVNNINHFYYALGLTFYLSALYFYIRFVQSLRKRLYIVAIILFILGIFTCKVLFTFPIILALYEILYRRSGTRGLLLRVLPFVIISLALSPFWLFCRPHPYYFKYPKLSVSAAWNSFFSVVGASGWCLKGLLLGKGIPVVLTETVKRILHFPHWRFILWIVVDLSLIVVSGWILRRKRWLGLGLLFIFVTMLPFVTIVWNRVDNYIDWPYLYIPTAGVALLLGGLADECWKLRTPQARRVVYLILSLVVVLYGVQQIRLNHFSRSPISYWSRALRLNPESETASRKLGESYLVRGEVEKAMNFLFSPAAKHLPPSCLAMARYYCNQKNYLAAAIHLQMSGQEERGLQFQHFEMVSGKLFHTVGALDYAEAALGKVLMANPYNTEAMEELADIWLHKGYVTAAKRLIARISKLSPSSPRLRQMLTAVNQYQKTALSTSLPVVEPPPPAWLRYAVQGKRNPELRGEIVRLSQRLPNDPVVRMEAGICLMREGKPREALSEFVFATHRLSSLDYAWAMRCWAALETGDYKEAEKAGQIGLRLNQRSPVVHRILGLLFSREAADPKVPDREEKLAQAITHYQLAIQLDPTSASTFNNLGNLLRRSGKLDEAIKYYHQALRLKPDFAEAHNNLGAALAQQGKIEEAVQHYRQALRLKPDFAEAYSNLGTALAQQGKLEEARLCLQRALDIQPLSRKTFFDLVVVLTQQRRFGQVISLLEQRLRQTPGDTGVALNLAWVLATCPQARFRNGSQALKLAKRVCQVTKYRNPRAIATLAAAYAELGQFDTAIQKARIALRIALASGKSQLAKRIQTHLKLYETHRPVR